VHRTRALGFDGDDGGLLGFGIWHAHNHRKPRTRSAARFQA
jgi:hypothetical protein